MKPRTHKYANAYQDGGRVTKKKTKKKAGKKKVTAADHRMQRTDDTMQSSNVGSTTDTLRNRRARQMEDLGLKDGGRVDPKNPPRRLRERPPMPRPKKGPKPKRIGSRNS